MTLLWMDESCHTHMTESMSHTWLNHVSHMCTTCNTYTRITYIQLSHVPREKEWYRTYEIESCHPYQRVSWHAWDSDALQMWMSHVTHANVNESCHTSNTLHIPLGKLRVGNDAHSLRIGVLVRETLLRTCGHVWKSRVSTSYEQYLMCVRYMSNVISRVLVSCRGIRLARETLMCCITPYDIFHRWESVTWAIFNFVYSCDNMSCRGIRLARETLVCYITPYAISYMW